MMQSEILLLQSSSSLSFQDDITTDFDQLLQFPSIIFSGEHLQYPVELGSIASESIENSSVFFYEHHHLQYYPLDKADDDDDLELPSLTEDFSMDLDAFDPISNAHIRYTEQSEGSIFSSQSQSQSEECWSPTPSMKSSEFSTVQHHQSLSLPPPQDMELENKVVIPHLLMAYGEAIDHNQNALAEETMRCISQKASPLGEDPLERSAFHVSSAQYMTENPLGHFLKQEACKNFEAARRAIYNGLPHGKSAHFAAISAILEALPEDSEVIHIIDFDIEEGVLWALMIEAISQQNRTLKITFMEWEGEEKTHEQTRRDLVEYARSCDVELEIEEKGFDDLARELKKVNKRDFLVFNCMVGLPHMPRGRSRRSVMEFLNLAKNTINENSSSNKGIITFADGEAIERLRNSMSFGSFFEGNMMHYKALLECMESHFPSRFAEARTAMEFLFVRPYVCSAKWKSEWEELREKWDCASEIGIELEGKRLGKRVLMEVREMVRGSEKSSNYEARIEGQNGNELVLEWKGIQLVRLSIWGN